VWEAIGGEDVGMRVRRTDCAFGGGIGRVSALGGFLLYWLRHCCGLAIGCEKGSVTRRVVWLLVC